MTKIPCNKERPVNNPHEVWQTPDGKWTWKVLKKWQIDDNKSGARWLCAVESPMTYGGCEIGDVFVADIKQYAQRITVENATIPKEKT